MGFRFYAIFTFSDLHQTVRSNTRNVHPSVTPSAALQLKCRLCPHEGI